MHVFNFETYAQLQTLLKKRFVRIHIYIIPDGVCDPCLYSSDVFHSLKMIYRGISLFDV